jgi:Tfp pilus assembly protein PilF
MRNTARALAVSSAIAIAIATAACGGPDKPTQAGGVDPPLPTGPSTSGVGVPPGPGSMPGAQSAPTSDSPDVARGVAAFDKGDFAGAQAAFEAAIKANAKDSVAHFNLGLTLERANKAADAEKEYLAALQLRPDFADVSVTLSSLYLNAEPPRADDAVSVAKAGLDKHPENGALHFNLAVALAAKSDQAGATKEFEEALKRTPADANARFTYGHWLGAWGQKDKALEQLKLALKTSDVGILAAVGHEMLLLREPAGCIAAYDKAIAAKDAAELRTERALCKLASKDEDGALADFKAAVAADPKYPLAHYWLGMRLAAGGKLVDAIAEFDTYLKLAPDGAKAKDAAAHKKDLEAKLKKK